MNKEIFPEDLQFIYELCSDEFSKLSGNSIFITGGTGFFGKWILESINYANTKLTTPISVYVLTRSPSKFNETFPNIINSNINLIEGSLEDFKIHEDCKYFLHAATDVASSLKNDSVEEQVNETEKAMTYLLEQIENSNISKILFTSSGAVYGSKNDSHEPSKEDETLGSFITNAYGQAKITAENMLSSGLINSNKDLSIARCFAFTGAHLPTNTTFAVGNFISNLLNDEDIIIKGDGTPQRTFMYMSDLCVWLFKLLVNTKGIHTYNVGSEEIVNIEELANEIAKHSSNCNVRILGEKSVGPVPSYIPSVSKASKELGLKNHHSFKESISKTIKWFKQ